MAHTWQIPGSRELVSDTTHDLYWHGQRIIKAHYRGSIIWEKASSGGDDIRFWDYDGTLLGAMSAEDFLRLSSYPDIHPSWATDDTSDGVHAYLSADGWNWSLEEAQAHVRSYRYLDIGALYTAEAAVVAHMKIDAAGDSVSIYFQSLAEYSIDWGDGNTDTAAGTGSTILANMRHSHTYAVAGHFIVRITGTNIQVGNMTAIGPGFSGSYFWGFCHCSQTGGNCVQNLKYLYVNGATISIGAFAQSQAYGVGFSRNTVFHTTYGITGTFFKNNFLQAIILPPAVTACGQTGLKFYYSPLSQGVKNYKYLPLSFSGSRLVRCVCLPPGWVGPHDRILDLGAERIIYPAHTQKMGIICDNYYGKHIQVCAASDAEISVVNENYTGVNDTPVLCNENAVFFVPSGSAGNFSSFPDSLKNALKEIVPPI